MDTPTDDTPPGWLEVLNESDAELAAGLTVGSDVVHRELQESMARLEAKDAARKREATVRL